MKNLWGTSFFKKIAPNLISSMRSAAGWCLEENLRLHSLPSRVGHTNPEIFRSGRLGWLMFGGFAL